MANPGHIQCVFKVSVPTGFWLHSNRLQSANLYVAIEKRWHLANYPPMIASVNIALQVEYLVQPVTGKGKQSRRQIN